MGLKACPLIGRGGRVCACKARPTSLVDIVSLVLASFFPLRHACSITLPLLGYTPRQASVFVRFFGDHTVCCLPAVAAGQRLPDRGGVLAFLTALEAGWHVRRTRGEAGSGAQARRFAQALCELRTYLQVGP